MKKILETLKQRWAEYLIEIIVIMIGILGAFTLNNWNELKKVNEKEQKILTSLFQDFKLNLQNLDSSLSLYPEMEDRGIKMLRLKGIPYEKRLQS